MKDKRMKRALDIAVWFAINAGMAWCIYQGPQGGNHGWTNVLLAWTSLLIIYAGDGAIFALEKFEYGSVDRTGNQAVPVQVTALVWLGMVLWLSYFGAWALAVMLFVADVLLWEFVRKVKKLWHEADEGDRPTPRPAR